MKKELSPAVTVGIIAVIVVGVIFAAWRTFAGPPPGDPSKTPYGFPGSAAAHAGQLPMGVAPPIGAPGTSSSPQAVAPGARQPTQGAGQLPMGVAPPVGAPGTSGYGQVGGSGN